nr:hypothetical protein [Actinomycetota bacterium]
IRRLYEALHGPGWLRAIGVTTILLLTLLLLLLIYEWVGSTFFDSGGTVG